MNDPINPRNPVDSMSAGLPGSPMEPANPQGPVNPVNPEPVYGEETNYSRIYQIALGVLGLILLVVAIFLIVYIQKANRTDAYINQKVEEGKAVKEEEVRGACELEKKDIRENPWANFTARDEFGAFKFQVPRNWAQYEHFDINDNNPYSVYFSQDIVRYDANNAIKSVHAPLEVIVSKKLYDAEIKAIQDEIKRNKDANKTEEVVNISNFQGTKLTYIDKDLGRRVGVIILPYRDRALFIKTDDYDKWNEKYYDKFYKSFALTP